MTCSEVQRVLPDVMDGSGDLEFQAHLKVCPDCSQLVSDLRWIASEARQLADSDEPPPRVWVNIANQLRAEGLIREPEMAPARPVLVPARPRRWSAWWLAPVTAAVLAAGAYQLSHKATSPSAPQAAQAPMTQPAAQPQVEQPRIAQSQETQPPMTQQAAKQAVAQTARPAAENLPQEAEISPPATAEDEQFLSEVSQGAPTMRATYEHQLRAVNAEIQETQEYIRRHPGDLDARQHLMEAYQQKAMLYQMALDHIQ